MARMPFVVRNQNGVGLPGRVLKLFRFADNVELGTFTDVGNGNYWIEHTVSEKVYVKDGGTLIVSTNGMDFPTDDQVLLADLAATTSGKGASLVGIEDFNSHFTATTVEGALFECATWAYLSSIGAGGGASLIGVQDTGNYYTGGTVEAVLAEIGPIKAALAGLTSSAAELNKLDGTSGNVTPANLNTLVAGAASDAGALHRHDMSALLGRTLQANDATYRDLILKGSLIGGIRGSVVMDVDDPDSPGQAVVHKRSESGVAITAEIMTDHEVGDLNFSGIPLLSAVTFPGKVTRALQVLGSAVVGIGQSTAGRGITRVPIWSGRQIAAAADGSLAADPATTTIWYDKSSSYKVKCWDVQFTQLPEMRMLRWKLGCKGDLTMKGWIKVEIATQAKEFNIVEVTYGKYFDDVIDLVASLPVTTPTDRVIKVYLKGDGTYGATVNGDSQIWAEV